MFNNRYNGMYVCDENARALSLSKIIIEGFLVLHNISINGTVYEG